MLLVYRNLGLPFGLFPVIFILRATFMTESSSLLMTIASQFSHLDHCYNWADLALPVEMIIPRSLPFGESCIIRMAYKFHVCCSDSTFKSLC